MQIYLLKVISNIILSDDLRAEMSNLDLNDLNQILFSSNVEEIANKGVGNGVYDLPQHGPFPYAGFAGVYQEQFEKMQG